MTSSPRDTAERLLTVAEAVLTGRQRLERTNPARAACWIGRRSLEFLVDAWLSERAVETGTARMAARLSCLAWAYREAPGFVMAVQQSWDWLSGGCHQHAYDLAPTLGEVTSLITSLRRLSGPTPAPAADLVAGPPPRIGSGIRVL